MDSFPWKSLPGSLRVCPLELKPRLFHARCSAQPQNRLCLNCQSTVTSIPALRTCLTPRFCTLSWLTPPRCRSPSDFALPGCLGTGLEVYYYVLSSGVNFTSACLDSTEKSANLSQGQALCHLLYFSQKLSTRRGSVKTC